jgi:hypothetical protein
MTIDWANFTPWASLAGGVLLGVASALFVLLNGRVLGISGILGGLLPPKQGDAGWRVSVLLGMFSAPLVYGLLAPEGFAKAPQHRCQLWPGGGGGFAGGAGHALRLGLHQRTRRVRALAPVAALPGGHAGLHGCGLRDGVPGPPRIRYLTV